MVLTYQALVIVTGVGAMIQPSWPMIIFFLVFMGLLMLKETHLDRRDAAERLPPPDPQPSQFNEDHEDWE